MGPPTSRRRDRSLRSGEHLRGPTLAPLDDPTTTLGFGDDPSLLATVAPERAVPRLERAVGRYTVHQTSTPPPTRILIAAGGRILFYR